MILSRSLKPTCFFDIKLILDKIVLDKAIVLDNIYYDLDKANIRADAAQELNKLVSILADNPEIKIELSSHTDSRAADDYNLSLSQRRADSAVNYIVSQGIEQNRIRARGYGETQLLIQDAQTEDQHQVNRRTEFKVYEYNPNTQRMEEIGNTAVRGLMEKSREAEEVEDPEDEEVSPDDESLEDEPTDSTQQKPVEERKKPESLDDMIDWDDGGLQE